MAYSQLIRYFSSVGKNQVALIISAPLHKLLCYMLAKKMLTGEIILVLLYFFPKLCFMFYHFKYMLHIFGIVKFLNC